MLARTPIQTLFYDYVVNRNPTDRYDWADFANCACGQFVREMDIEPDRETYRLIWGRYPVPTLPIRATEASSLNGLAYGDGTSDDWNFGALRLRLEAVGYGA